MMNFLVLKFKKSRNLYICLEKEECYNNSWMKVYHDIEKLFEPWKNRKLTLFGKSCIFNTLSISKLTYAATIHIFPDKECIAKLQRFLYNFIWVKTERTKRNTLYCGFINIR